MDIKAILYDLDGVLVDACDWHYLSFNKALKEVSDIEISRLEHESDFNGLPTATKLKKLIKSNRIKESDSKTIWDLKQKYTLEVICENTRQDLEKQKLHRWVKNQNIKIACVTNSIELTAKAMLKSTCQDSYFDLLVSNESVSENKPSPMPYIYAMDILGVTTSETLIVEDSEVGYKSALASGAYVWKVGGCLEVNLENLRKKLDGLKTIRKDS